MFLYINILVYLLFVLFVIIMLRPKPYTFVFIFLAYGFFAYFVGFLVFKQYPELSIIVKVPVPRQGEFFNYDFFEDSFFLYTLGVISFCLPFLLFKNIKLRKNILNNFIRNFQINTSLCFIAALVFGFISFVIRKYYQAGVPTAVKSSSRFVEYSWYLVDYITIIFLVLVIYKSFISKSILQTVLAVLVSLFYGLSLILLGWKSGFIWVGLFFFHILFYSFFKNINRSKATKLIILFSFISVFCFPVIFAAGKTIRYNIRTKQHLSTPRIIAIARTTIIKSFSKGNINYMFNRITGISTLFPTLAYSSPQGQHDISFFKNLFTRGSYQPESYYGCIIMRDDSSCPPVKSTFAPGGWSVFYIYGRTFGVVLGFFILGVIFSVLEKILLDSISINENVMPIYTVCYSMILPAMVYEGTIVFYFKRHVLSFGFACFLIWSLVSLVNVIKK